MPCETLVCGLFFFIHLLVKQVGEYSCGICHHFAAWLLTHAQQPSADDISIFRSEPIAQGTHLSSIARQSSNHSHSTDTSTQLSLSRQSSTEGGSKTVGGISIYTNLINIGQQDRLTAVVMVGMKRTSLILSFFLCHFCFGLNI